MPSLTVGLLSSASPTCLQPAHRYSPLIEFPELFWQSPVAFGLQQKQLGVNAALSQQLGMRPIFNNLALSQHNDSVSHAHGGKAVGDNHGRSSRDQLREAQKHLILGPGVQGRGGFVENQNLSFPHVGSCQRHLLPLTAGQIHAIIETAPQHLLITFLEAGQ